MSNECIRFWKPAEYVLINCCLSWLLYLYPADGGVAFLLNVCKWYQNLEEHSLFSELSFLLAVQILTLQNKMHVARY